MAKQIKTGEFGVLEVIRDDGSKNTVHPLKPGSFTIGASLHVNIRLTAKKVLDLHCIVHVHDNGVATLMPQSTYYSTMINNKIIRKDKKTLLKHEDAILIGDVKILYKNNSLTEQEIQQKGKAVVKSKIFGTPRRSGVVKQTPVSSSVKKKKFNTPVSRFKPLQRRKSSASVSSDKFPNAWESEPTLVPREQHVTGDTIEEDPHDVDIPDNEKLLEKKATKSTTPSLFSTDSNSSTKSEMPWTTGKSVQPVKRANKQLSRRRSVSDLTASELSSPLTKRKKSFMPSSKKTQIPVKTPVTNKSKYNNPELATSTPVASTPSRQSVSEPRNQKITASKSSLLRPGSGKRQSAASTTLTKAKRQLSVDNVAQATEFLGSSYSKKETRRSKSLCSRQSGSSPISLYGSSNSVVLDSTSEEKETWETSSIGSPDNISIHNTTAESSTLDTTGSSSFVYQNSPTSSVEIIEPDFNVSGVKILTKTPEKEVRKSRSSVRGAPVEVHRSTTPLHTYCEGFISTDDDEEEDTIKATTSDGKSVRSSIFDQNSGLTEPVLGISGIENLAKTPEGNKVQVRHSRSSAAAPTNLGSDDSSSNDPDDDEETVILNNKEVMTTPKAGSDLSGSGLENLAKTPTRNSRSAIKSARKTDSALAEKRSTTLMSFAKTFNDDSFVANDDPDMEDCAEEQIDDSIDISDEEIMTAKPGSDLSVVELEILAKTPTSAVQVRSSRSAVKSARKTDSAIAEKRSTTLMSFAKTFNDDSFVANDDPDMEDCAEEQIDDSIDISDEEIMTAKPGSDLSVVGLEILAKTPTSAVQGRSSRSAVKSARKTDSAIAEKRSTALMSFAKTFNDDSFVANDDPDMEDCAEEQIDDSIDISDEEIMTAKPGSDLSVVGLEILAKTPTSAVQVRSSRSAVKSARKTDSAIAEKRSTTLMSFAKTFNDDSFAANDDPDMEDCAEEQIDDSIDISDEEIMAPNPGSYLSVGGLENLAQTPTNAIHVRSSRSAARKTDSAVAEKRSTTLLSFSKTFNHDSFAENDDPDMEDCAKEQIDDSIDISDEEIMTAKPGSDLSVVELEILAKTPTSAVQVRSSRSAVKSARKTDSAIAEKRSTTLMSFSKTFNDDSFVANNDPDMKDCTKEQEDNLIDVSDEEIMTLKPGNDLSVGETENLTKTPKNAVQVRNSRSAVKSARKNDSTIAEKRSTTPLMSFSKNFNDYSFAENDEPDMEDSTIEEKDNSCDLSDEEVMTPIPENDPSVSGLENLAETPTNAVQIRNSRSAVKSARKTESAIAEKRSTLLMSFSKTFNDDSFVANNDPDMEDCAKEQEDNFIDVSDEEIMTLKPGNDLSVGETENLTKTPKNAVQARNSRSAVKSARKNDSTIAEKRSTTPLMSFSKNFNDDSFAENDEPDMEDSTIEEKDNSCDLSDEEVMTAIPENDPSVSGLENLAKTPTNAVQIRNSRSAVKSARKTDSAVAEKRSTTPLMAFSKNFNDDSLAENDEPDMEDSTKEDSIDVSDGEVMTPILGNDPSISGLENLTKTPTNVVHVRSSRSAVKSARKTDSAIAEKRSTPLITFSKNFNNDSVAENDDPDMEDSIIEQKDNSIDVSDEEIIKTPKPGNSDSGLENLAETPKNVAQVRNSRSAVKSARKTESAIAEKRSTPLMTFSKNSNDDSVAENHDPDMVDSTIEQKDNSIDVSDEEIIKTPKPGNSDSGLENLAETPKNVAQVRNSRSAVKSARKTESAIAEKRSTPLMTFSKNSNDDSVAENDHPDMEDSTIEQKDNSIDVSGKTIMKTPKPTKSPRSAKKSFGTKSLIDQNSPQETSVQLFDISDTESLSKTPKTMITSSIKSVRSSSKIAEKRDVTPFISFSRTFNATLNDNEEENTEEHSRVIEETFNDDLSTPKAKQASININTRGRSNKKLVGSSSPIDPIPSTSKQIIEPIFDANGTENPKMTPKQGRNSAKNKSAQKISVASPRSASKLLNSDVSSDENTEEEPKITKTRIIKTPKPIKSPKNDLTDIRGVKKLMKTPKTINSPKNDLRNLPAIKYLFQTAPKSPDNSLTDVRGVKRLLKTPGKQNSPKNDLGDVKGVKRLMKTPKVVNSPKNDLGDVKGVKRLMKTPKTINSPKNDLRNLPAIKCLFQTAPKSPDNSLTDVRGVKRLLKTPGKQNSPKNDLGNVKGVKRLMKTPKVAKSPKNDLRDVKGVKGILKTPRTRRSPQNDLTNPAEFKKLFEIPKSGGLENLEGIQELMATPAVVKRTRTKTYKGAILASESEEKARAAKRGREKATKSDYSDVRGVKRMFAEEEAAERNTSNVSGVAELFNTSETFTAVFNKKPLRTYPSKTPPSPYKLSRLEIDRKNVENSSDEALVSPDVVNWVNTVNQELETNTLASASEVSPNKQLLSPVMALKRSNRIAARTPTPSKSKENSSGKGKKENDSKALEAKSPGKHHKIPIVVLNRSSSPRKNIDSPAVPIKINLHASTPNDKIDDAREQSHVKKIKTGILKETSSSNINNSVGIARGRRKKEPTKENVTPDKSDTTSDAQKKVQFQIAEEETRRSQRTPRKPAKFEGFISEMPSRRQSKDEENQDKEVIKQNTRKRGAKAIDNEPLEGNEPQPTKKTRKNAKSVVEEVEDKSQADEGKKPAMKRRGKQVDNNDDSEVIEDKKPTRGRKKKINVEDAHNDVESEKVKSRPKRGQKQKGNESVDEDLDPEEALPVKRRQRNALGSETVEKETDNDEKVKTRPKKGQKQKGNESVDEDLDPEEALPVKRRQRNALGSETVEKETDNDEKVKTRPKRGQKQKRNESVDEEDQDLDSEDTLPLKRRQRNAKGSETAEKQPDNDEKLKARPKTGQKQKGNESVDEEDQDLDSEDALPLKRRQRGAKGSETAKKETDGDEKVKARPKRGQKQKGNESVDEDLEPEEALPLKRRQGKAQVNETPKKKPDNDEKVKARPKMGQKQKGNQSVDEDLESEEALPVKKRQGKAQVNETPKKKPDNDEKVKTRPKRAQKRKENESDDEDPEPEEASSVKRRQRNARGSETTEKHPDNDENAKTRTKRGQKQKGNESADENSEDEVLPVRKRGKQVQEAEIESDVSVINNEKVKNRPARPQKQKDDVAPEIVLSPKKRGRKPKINAKPETELLETGVIFVSQEQPRKRGRPRLSSTPQLQQKPTTRRGRKRLNHEIDNSPEILNTTEPDEVTSPKRTGKNNNNEDTKKTADKVTKKTAKRAAVKEQADDDESGATPVQKNTRRGAAGKQEGPQQKSKRAKKEVVEEVVPIRKSARTRK